jgi:hypothetical protein
MRRVVPAITPARKLGIIGVGVPKLGELALPVLPVPPVPPAPPVPVPPVPLVPPVLLPVEGGGGGAGKTTTLPVALVVVVVTPSALLLLELDDAPDDASVQPMQPSGETGSDRPAVMPSSCKSLSLSAADALPAMNENATTPILTKSILIVFIERPPLWHALARASTSRESAPIVDCRFVRAQKIICSIALQSRISLIARSAAGAREVIRTGQDRAENTRGKLGNMIGKLRGGL